MLLVYSNIIYLNRTNYYRQEVKQCLRGPDAKIEVVYEGGVFKPLREVDLHEGTKAFVVLKPGRITKIARRYRMKVDRDVMAEFVAERR